MVPVNPAAHLLGTTNAIVAGRGVRRYEQRFAGPLSIKSVVSGTASWATRAGRFEVGPGCVLVLNEGEEYEITVDALQPVETFCLFFERGFVEDAWWASVNGSAALLDQAGRSPMTFEEKLHFEMPLVAEMRRAHGRMGAGAAMEDSFFAAAMELVRLRGDSVSRVARIPALRASTREELARRIGVATAFLHASLDRKVTVVEAAREACLSPFHFHRLFTAFHGATPHRYLIHLRLERARELLRNSDGRVADIAAACGFESAGSFATLFRRTFGASPRAIRKNGEVSGGGRR